MTDLLDHQQVHAVSRARSIPEISRPFQIDLSTVAHEFTKHIDQVLRQLQLGQVSAEGRPGEPEKNDLDQVPTPPSIGAAAVTFRPGVGQAAGS